MNPMTNMKNVLKLSERELQSSMKTSWHDQYKHSAWVFVGGLPYDLTEGDIICVFSQYGEVVNINLVRDKGTGKSRGFCFICYQDQRSTNLIVDNFNGIKLLNRTIRVDHCEGYKAPKDDKMDEESRQLHVEGCAPGSKFGNAAQLPSASSCSNGGLDKGLNLPPIESLLKIKSEKEDVPKKKKAKKGKKEKKPKKVKEKIRKIFKKRESSDSSSSGSSEESSSNSDDTIAKKHKSQKKLKRKKQEESTSSSEESESEGQYRGKDQKKRGNKKKVRNSSSDSDEDVGKSGKAVPKKAIQPQEENIARHCSSGSEIEQEGKRRMDVKRVTHKEREFWNKDEKYNHKQEPKRNDNFSFLERKGRDETYRSYTSGRDSRNAPGVQRSQNDAGRSDISHRWSDKDKSDRHRDGNSRFEDERRNRDDRREDRSREMIRDRNRDDNGKYESERKCKDDRRNVEHHRRNDDRRQY